MAYTKEFAKPVNKEFQGIKSPRDFGPPPDLPGGIGVVWIRWNDPDSPHKGDELGTVAYSQPRLPNEPTD